LGFEVSARFSESNELIFKMTVRELSLNGEIRKKEKDIRVKQ